MGIVKERKNRSDAVRSRRNKRVKKKTVRNIKSGSASARRIATPTVVRTRSMAQRSGRRKKLAVQRKRSYLQLASAGAEIRLPAMPNLKLGWRFVSSLLVAVCSLAIYMAISSPLLQVRTVDIVGLQRIESQDVNAVLGVYGASIFSLAPAQLIQNLGAAFPEMTDISVKIGFPARVIVEAGERTPLIIWEHNGRSDWVDQDGVAFPKRGSQEGLVRVLALQAPPPLPGIEHLQDQIITAEMVNAIITLNAQSPPDTNLLYDPQHGLGWQDPAGWQVFFGPNPEDMDLRLLIYSSMLDMFMDRQIKPIFISLEYLHAPYFRLVASE